MPQKKKHGRLFESLRGLGRGSNQFLHCHSVNSLGKPGSFLRAIYAVEDTKHGAIGATFLIKKLKVKVERDRHCHHTQSLPTSCSQ